jgi:hypothetical protein
MSRHEECAFGAHCRFIPLVGSRGEAWGFPGTPAWFAFALHDAGYWPT